MDTKMLKKREVVAKKPALVKRRRHQQKADSEVLAILVDSRSGREYYVSKIDSFVYKNRNYVVMHNFEPDAGKKKFPEILIMHAYHDTGGEQIFTSIRSKKELEEVFEIFYQRYNGGQDES